MEPSLLSDSHPSRVIATTLARFGGILRWWSAARGLALLALAAAGIACASFAVDYSLEPSQGVRIALLSVAIVAFGFHTWTMVISPLVVALPPTSLAMAIERRAPEFGARMLTAVELREFPLSPALLERIQREAAEVARHSRVTDLLTFHPTLRLLALAVVGFGALAVAAAVRPDLAAFWVRRTVMLEAVRYPRATSVAVTGFVDGVRKVGRGRDVDLSFRAGGRIPDRAKLEISAGRGGRRREILSVSPTGEFQARFRSVVQPVEFVVEAGDERTETLRLEPVDPPGVARVEIEITPPSYTRRPARNAEWTTGAVEAPMGSTATIRVTFDRPAKVLDASLGNLSVEGERPTSEVCVVAWDAFESKRLRISFANVDGVEGDEPFSLNLVAVEDRLPTFEKAEPTNVGPTVTRLAALPFAIELKDDFGVESAGVVVMKPGSSQPLRFPFQPTESRPLVELGSLNLKEGDKFNLHIEAADLPPLVPFLGEPWNSHWSRRTVRSPAFAFEIVAPDELLARLAARELDFRKRFEQTLRECRAARASLDDVVKAKSAGATLQKLRIDESLHAIRKSANETRELAAAFFGLIEEYRNNRVGATGALERLERSVASPLRKLAKDSFAARVREIQTASAATTNFAAPAAAAVVGLEALLRDGEAILAAMRKMENYHELVSTLRTLRDEQGKLLNETKEERKRRILDLVK